MSKFVTKTIEEVKGRKKYEQLIILPDSTNLEKIDLAKVEGIWDAYRNSLEARYESSFKGLLGVMNRDANMQSLSSNMFKDVTPHGESVKEYEVKYQDLRAYAIKIPNGKLVILGGYKNQQKNDYTQFQSLKKRYLESLKP